MNEITLVSQESSLEFHILVLVFVRPFSVGKGKGRPENTKMIPIAYLRVE